MTFLDCISTKLQTHFNSSLNATQVDNFLFNLDSVNEKYCFFVTVV